MFFKKIFLKKMWMNTYNNQKLLYITIYNKFSVPIYVKEMSCIKTKHVTVLLVHKVCTFKRQY